MKKIAVIAVITLAVVLVYYTCPKSGIKSETPNASQDTTDVQTNQDDSVTPAPFESSSMSVLSTTQRTDTFNVYSIIKKQEEENIRQFAKWIFEKDGIQFTDSNFTEFISRLRYEKMPPVPEYCNHWGPQPHPFDGKCEIDVNHQFWNRK